MKRDNPIDADLTAPALAPFKYAAWPAMTPAERMRRCLRLRRLIPNPKRIHDQKLFPAIAELKKLHAQNRLMPEGELV